MNHSAAGDDPVHRPHIFGEAAAGRVEAGGHAHAFVPRALGERLLAAVVAASAGNMMKHRHPVADREALDAAPQGGDAPTVSCPKIRGAACEPVWIFLRSVPQTPHAATRTKASPGRSREPEPSRRKCDPDRDKQRPASSPSKRATAAPAGLSRSCAMPNASFLRSLPESPSAVVCGRPRRAASAALTAKRPRRRRGRRCLSRRKMWDFCNGVKINVASAYRRSGCRTARPVVHCRRESHVW